jgi:multidrug resistance efflux pump
MIAFLTLLYVGVLALLIKLGVIRLTLWWKISPAVWMVVLLVALFIPMQWGAPAGAVTIYQKVVEVIPNVSGEVIEVPSRALSIMEKGEVLFKIDPRPYEYALADLEASLEAAQADFEYSKSQYDRAVVLERTEVAAPADFDLWQKRYRSAAATIKNIEAQIDDARYNLEETIVRAPARGWPIGLTLQPGQRVTNMPMRSWISYVDSEASIIIAGINQNTLRFVEPGQRAEVVLSLYPGKTFSARVKSVALATPGGQLQPTGLVPAAPTAQLVAAPYGVVLELEDPELSLLGLPAGAVGTAAVYTEAVKATHLIRKVMMRMQTFLNYVLPS